MNFQQLKQHLTNLGIVPGSGPIKLKCLAVLLRTTTKWYGPQWAKQLLDFFTPTGGSILAGYEDSLSHYLFCVDTWGELEAEWPSKGYKNFQPFNIFKDDQSK